MARLPKCISCINCKGWKSVCKIYPKGIPKEIFTEQVECGEFVLNEERITNKDLPVAKGR